VKVRMALSLALAMLLAATLAVRAGGEDDFKTVYAAAETANRQAGLLKNQWPATAEALAAAKKAASAGEFDQALALARNAEALAQASIAQSKLEAQAWTAAELR
jgi:hypothetical protein